MSTTVGGSHPAPLVHQHIDYQRDKMIVDVEHAIQDCKYNELKTIVGNDRALLLDLLNNHLIPKHLEHSTHITFLSSLLCYAILCGDKEIVERLISYDYIPLFFVQFLLVNEHNVIDKTARELTESDVSFKIEKDAFHKGTNATGIPQYRNIPCILMCAAAQGHTMIVEQLINTPELFNTLNSYSLAHALSISIRHKRQDIIRLLTNKIESNILYDILLSIIKDLDFIKTLIEGMDIDKLSGVLIHAIRIEDTNFIRMLFDAVNFDKLDRAFIHAIRINDAGLIKKLFHGIHLDRLVHAIMIEDINFTRTLLNEMGLIKISPLLIDQIGINNVVIAKTFANNLREDQLSDVLVKFVQHIDAASSLMREIDIDRLYEALSIIIEKNEFKTVKKLLSVIDSHKLYEMLNRGCATGLSPSLSILIKYTGHIKLYELLNFSIEKDESHLLIPLTTEATTQSLVDILSYAITNKNTNIVNLLIACSGSIHNILITAIREGRNDVALVLINSLTITPDDLTNALMVAIMNDRHEIALALPRAIAQSRNKFSGEVSPDDLVLIQDAQKGYKELLIGFFDTLNSHSLGHALFISTRYKRLDIIRLLTNKIEVNTLYDILLPLIEDVDFIKTLIQGMAINKLSDVVKTAIANRRNNVALVLLEEALECAAINGCEDMMNSVLSLLKTTQTTSAIHSVLLKAFKQACKDGRESIADQLFGGYRHLFKRDDWQAIIEQAAQNGHETIVRNLLPKMDRFLSWCLQHEAYEIVELKGVGGYLRSIIHPSLVLAAKHGQINIIRTFIDFIKLTSWSPWHASVTLKTSEIKENVIRAMIEALTQAARAGHTAIVQELIASIQSLEPSNWHIVVEKAVGEAVEQEAQDGHAKMVQHLITSALPIDPSALNNALIKAAENNRIAAMKELISCRRFPEIFDLFAHTLAENFRNNKLEIVHRLFNIISEYKTSFLYEIITHIPLQDRMRILQWLVKDPLLGKVFAFAIHKNNNDIVAFCMKHMDFDAMDPEDLGDALIEDVQKPTNYALIFKLHETKTLRKISADRAGFALLIAIEQRNLSVLNILIDYADITNYANINDEDLEVAETSLAGTKYVLTKELIRQRRLFGQTTRDGCRDFK